MKRQNFTCEESLSMDIMEYVYAEDDKFYEQEEDLIFNVDNYWKGIVVPTREKIYGEQQ